MYKCERECVYVGGGIVRVWSGLGLWLRFVDDIFLF